MIAFRSHQMPLVLLEQLNDVADFEGHESSISSTGRTESPTADRNPVSLAAKRSFRGTRVPVDALFKHLDQGSTIDEFLRWFPSVSREQAHNVLTPAKSSLEQPAAIV